MPQPYPEDPIVFKQNATDCFAPMDERAACRVGKTFHFSIGGAFKSCGPSSPSGDEPINGRVISQAVQTKRRCSEHRMRRMPKIRHGPLVGSLTSLTPASFIAAI